MRNTMVSLESLNLINAVLSGELSAVQRCLAKGADVNVRTSDSHTPLMFAAMRGYDQIADLLIEHGALIDAVDRFNRSALLWAAYSCKPQCVMLLLKHGADAGLEDADKKTVKDYIVIDYLDMPIQGSLLAALGAAPEPGYHFSPQF